MMKLAYILCCLVAFQFNAVAQSIPAIAMGNKVPEELMSYLTVHSKNTNNQVSLKHKVIILDFWALGCIPCFKAFPEMDSLQNLYKNDIQIITVTGADSMRIKDYFAKFGKRMNIHLPNLPAIINDTLLSKYFPHTFVPHIVWINKDGTFLAATGHTEVTSRKIENLLKGNKVDFIKKTDVLNEDLNIPMRKQNFMSRYIKYSTTFARYVPGGPAQFGFKADKERGVYRLFFFNTDIANIIKIAYGGTLVNNPFVENPKRVISNIDFKDPNPNDTKVHNEWLAKYFINYEIEVPMELKDSIYSLLKNDISRIVKLYYNIDCSIEYKTVQCYSLIQLDSLKRFKSNSISPSLTEYSSDSIFKMNSQLLSSFIRGLRYTHKNGNIFFLDNTNFHGLVDIIIPTGLGDLSHVNNALRKVGLQLIGEKKPLPFLVFQYRLK